MSSLANIKNEAQTAMNSTNPEIQGLGNALMELARYVDVVERKAQDAARDASRAMSDARRK
jgi:hypothetical protein